MPLDPRQKRYIIVRCSIARSSYRAVLEQIQDDLAA